MATSEWWSGKDSGTKSRAKMQRLAQWILIRIYYFCREQHLSVSRRIPEEGRSCHVMEYWLAADPVRRTSDLEGESRRCKNGRLDPSLQCSLTETSSSTRRTGHLSGAQAPMAILIPSWCWRLTALLQLSTHRDTQFSGHRHISLKVPNVKFDFDVWFSTLM